MERTVVTADERAVAGLHEQKKMAAPGWVRSVTLIRSFGLGNAGLGCGRVVQLVREEDCDTGRRGIGDGVGSEGAVDMASGVGSGIGVWSFISIQCSTLYTR